MTPTTEPTNKVIVYAFGPDRPGLVCALSRAVLNARGNIEESRMTRLGGDFNVMMAVGFEDAESPVGAFALVIASPWVTRGGLDVDGEGWGDEPTVA